MLFIAITSFALLANFYVPLAHSKDVEKESNIGERFHHDTSLTWLSVIRDLFRGRSKKPPQYKNYPDSKIIKLPNPVYQGISLEEAIVK